MTIRSCPHCQREWRNVPDHVIVLFHQCPAHLLNRLPGRRPTIARRPSKKELNADDRRAWAMKTFGLSLEEALGESALLPVDDEEEEE